MYKRFGLLTIVSMAVMYLQKTPFAIDSFQLLLMFTGSISYFALSCMNVIFIKNKYDFGDVITSAIIMFSVNIIQKLIGAILFPDADKNKDGVLTTSEFYLWKNGVDAKLSGKNKNEHQ
jgi:hypothetical protein